MKYARLENQSLVYAPRITTIGNFLVVNPSPEQCESMGYYPVFETPYPEEIQNGYKAVAVWEEQTYQIKPEVETLSLVKEEKAPLEKKKIVQSWKIVPIDPSDRKDNRPILERLDDLENQVSDLQTVQTSL